MSIRAEGAAFLNAACTARISAIGWRVMAKEYPRNANRYLDSAGRRIDDARFYVEMASRRRDTEKLP